MEKKIARGQTFRQKLALCVVAGTMFLFGFILTEVEPVGIQEGSSFVWLHSIGMLTALSSVLVFDEIKGKREFLMNLKRHWRLVVNIIFK